MPFTQEVRDYITDYAKSHLPPEDWYDEYFSFIQDEKLANRLKIEFKNARFIYKVFEGLQATDELLLAQVRTQIIMYVSVYEAALHYILFEHYMETQDVKELIERPTAVPISIPAQQKQKIEKELSHDGKEIIPYYIKSKKRDITKIRFDEKCKVANKLSLIDDSLTSELINLYDIRNAVHIHAEIRKQLEYELSQSMLAYWRFRKFKLQVQAQLQKDNKISEVNLTKTT